MKWSYFLFSLVGATIVSGSLLSSSYTSATSTSANASVTVGSACSLTSSGNNHSATISPGNYTPDIGTTNISVICNDPGGYALYAVGYTNNEYGTTSLNGNDSGQTIVTGTATGSSSSDPSNWAMKLTPVTGTYAPTIENSFGSYHVVPSTYTKVASFGSTTDTTTGSKLTTTYAAYISGNQAADTYTGKVKYTMVHPSTEIPAQPQTSAANKICYYANTSTAVGTMGCQEVTTSATSATLFASNFSRTGYGFAGWSDAFDYATNNNAHFYGPNEDISFTAGQYTGNNNGLSLYAVWVKSQGNLQDTTKVAQLCGTGTGSLTAATYDNENDDDESTWSITAGLSSVSALTDTRDNNTYAIAKLSDGNCWMIENLRLDNTAELTTTNTNNPLNNGTTVTLKHNYTDTETYNTLSPTSSVAYDADTAPGGWCTTNSADCDDQSRLRTNNTANRVTYAQNDTMSSTSANLYSYGNYYNWYSATAGNGTYSKSSGNTAGDLCPAGWHVPTGHSTSAASSGEFGLLSNSLGGYKNASNVAQNMSSSTTPTSTIMYARLRHYPNNFVYSGYIRGASFSDRGIDGSYWSSTADSSTFAYYLYFRSSNVRPGTYNSGNKYIGRTLRCMAPVSP